MPVRIYDIAKKFGLENKEILVKAKALGIAAAKVPSSSLDKISAEWLEEELLKIIPISPPGLLRRRRRTSQTRAGRGKNRPHHRARPTAAGSKPGRSEPRRPG